MDSSVIGLMAFVIISPTALYFIQRHDQQKLLGVLVLDGRAFFDGLVELIQKQAGKASLLGSFFPRQPSEYLSFFHHIYIPYFEEQQERAVHLTAKGVKVVAACTGAVFFLMLGLTLLVKYGIHKGFYLIFPELGLMMVAVFGCMALVMWLLLKSSVDTNKLLKRIDKKVIELSNGAVPPPYWAPLSDVLAESDRLTENRLSLFGKKKA